VYLLYDLALILAAVLLLPRYLLRGVGRGSWRQGLGERFGSISPGKLAALAGRKVIWVHAVSVGEVRAATPLLRELRKARPDAALVLTTVTESGGEIGRSLEEIDLHCYFPFDLSWIVRKALKAVRPVMVVMVETEIWPNFVRFARRLDIPVALVNGRISDRSFPRYRLVRPWLRPVLGAYSVLGMQSDEDAERIRTLGAPEDRITVTGNLKYDLEPDSRNDDVPRLRDRFGLPPEGLIWVAGSTHDGEEETVLEVFQTLGRDGRRVTLVLIPRHPHRSNAVAGLLARKKIEFVLRSRLSNPPAGLGPGVVLLVDSFGEAASLYALADLVFVGGSLVPAGGHNPLEAAMVRRPVLFGPHMENFREIAGAIVEWGAGRMVSGPSGLLNDVSGLLDDPGERNRMGERGLALIRHHAGAAGRTQALLDPILET